MDRVAASVPEVIRERSAVRARLLADLADMAPAQRRLASYLLVHIAFAGEQTITELAESAGVSIGTVSKLCYRLGLKGYPELRLALAREAALLETRENTLSRPASSERGTPKPGDAESCLYRVFGANREALDETSRAVSLPALERSAAMLAAARRIEWAGAGTAGLVAAEGAHKLRRLGLPSASFLDGHIQAMSASLLGPEGVLVVVSHSGRTLDSLACARAAKDSGAKIIAITKMGRSPLADLADAVIGTISYDAEFTIEPMASALVEISVVHVLFLMLLERGGSQTRDSLDRSNAAVEGRHRREKPRRDRIEVHPGLSSSTAVLPASDV